MEPDPIKTYLSQWLQIDDRRLNEISIDDITFSDPARADINRCVAPLLKGAVKGAEPMPIDGPLKGDDLPCKSFWVDHTFELVLFVWIGAQAKTVIVESEGWRLRDDISVH